MKVKIGVPYRWISLGLAFLLGIVGTIALPTLTLAKAPDRAPIEQAAQPGDTGLDRARQLYETGRFTDAIAILQPILKNYQDQGDRVGAATVLSNLALNHQQLGAWDAATQAIDQALALLRAAPATPDRASVQAQVLEVQGGGFLARGNAESALESWEQATRLYQQIGNVDRAVRTQVNQSQAYLALGMFPRAIATLETAQAALKKQPESIAKAATLRSLGDVQKATGNLEAAEKSLRESLVIAQRLQDSDAIAAANLSLGNVTFVQARVRRSQDDEEGTRKDLNAALGFYRAVDSPTALIMAKAAVNQFQLLTSTPAELLTGVDRWAEVARFYPQVRSRLANLPPSRSAVLLQINLGQRLLRWQQRNPANAPAWTEIAQPFATAVQQAKTLNDPRTLSEALGNLGTLYEKTQQWSESQNLTQQALLLSQATDASELSYRWQWQLGRVLCRGALPCPAGNDVNSAIAAYTAAFDTLQSIRRDLVAVNTDVQFTFQESVEPVYRQLANLLLQSQGDREASPANLQQARTVLEALRLAELDDFLQVACQGGSLQIDRVIDRLDLTSAVIYPIILDDRLEVILKLPGQADLYHYPPVRLPRQKIEATLADLQSHLQDESNFEDVENEAGEVYKWLVRPAHDRLAASGIKTLVFVLDGPFRNIPMAVLYDGEKYLVEKYATSLVLGLQVREPKPLQRQALKVLGASLTDPPAEFARTYGRLDNVNPELDQIKTQGVASTFLRDQAFTKEKFKQTVESDRFSVVHLATHGQFGDSRKSTYLLTADGAIYMDDLGEVFRSRDPARAIELLILSACKTATGNNRAVLGIAGTAVRAGARSAIASLWSLADAPGVGFAQEFYKHLGEPGVSKAEAMRRAQVSLLNSTAKDYSHPRFWAPYILIGNWL